MASLTFSRSSQPRKFKIAIAVPPTNDVDVYCHDLGYIAILDADKELVGFNVTVGGGMGVTQCASPSTSSALKLETDPDWLLAAPSRRPTRVSPTSSDSSPPSRESRSPRPSSPPSATTATAPSMPSSFISSKPLADLAPRSRKNARVKYTVDRMGIKAFMAEVESRLGYSLAPARPFTFTSNVDEFGWQTGYDGKRHFTAFVENGRVIDEPGKQFKTALREIAQVHKGVFRLTANQHVIIADIPKEEEKAIQSILTKYKLDDVDFSALRLSSAACVAFPVRPFLIPYTQ